MSTMDTLAPISATVPTTTADDTIGMIAPVVTVGGLVAAAAVGAALGAATGVALGTAYYVGYQDGQAASTSQDKPKNK